MSKDLESKARTLRGLEDTLTQGQATYVSPEKITLIRDKWDIFTGKLYNSIYYSTMCQQKDH